MASSSTKVNVKGKRTKKKKTKVEVINEVTSNGCGIKEIIEGVQLLVEKDKVQEDQQDKETTSLDVHTSKVVKKKRMKKITHFPGYSEILKNNTLWYTSMKSLLNNLKSSNQPNSCKVGNNELNTEKKVDNLEEVLCHVPNLLGDKNDLLGALSYES